MNLFFDWQKKGIALRVKHNNKTKNSSFSGEAVGQI
jgi:hypothetical protein